jgi:hypothetical protein
MRQSDTVSPIEGVQGQRSQEIGFRPDIEGLRGLTLLAILGFHVAMPGVGGGFVGPDIFFFISGFVITGQLWREVSTTGTVGLRKFYGKRPAAASGIGHGRRRHRDRFGSAVTPAAG